RLSELGGERAHQVEDLFHVEPDEAAVDLIPEPRVHVLKLDFHRVTESHNRTQLRRVLSAFNY
ncbi:MAG: hypothetical protein LC118_05320, partial [Dehalococcoidia bacterium]|nr:hypothetical protein [Dehalococcoidia bacterium]